MHPSLAESFTATPTPPVLAGFVMEGCLSLQAGPPVQAFSVYIPPGDAATAAAVRTHVLTRRALGAARGTVAIIAGDFNGALYECDRPHAAPHSQDALTRDATHIEFVSALNAGPVDDGADRSPSFHPEGTDASRLARLDDVLWCCTGRGGRPLLAGTLRVLTAAEFATTSDHTHVMAHVNLAAIDVCLPQMPATADNAKSSSDNDDDDAMAAAAAPPPLPRHLDARKPAPSIVAELFVAEALCSCSGVYSRGCRVAARASARTRRRHPAPRTLLYASWPRGAPLAGC
jgi:hypothetical protein